LIITWFFLKCQQIKGFFRVSMTNNTCQKHIIKIYFICLNFFIKIKVPAQVAEQVDAQDLGPFWASEHQGRNNLCEIVQIRGNLTDNADGNPEPKFCASSK